MAPFNVKNATKRTIKGLIGFAADGKGGMMLKQTLARGYMGVDPRNDPTEMMASPPTVIVGVDNAVSAITGAANGTLNVAANDYTKISHVGGPGVPVLTQTAYYSYQPGGGGFNIRYQRIRFTHIGRRFEFRLRPTTLQRPAFSIRVDGKLVSKTWQSGVRRSSSANQLVLVDFGANTETAKVVSCSVSAGGTGHAVDDIITISGGTGTPATLRVTAVSGGVVTGVTVETQGSYSVAPTSPQAQASTTGAGTGFSATLIRGYSESTIKARNIEIILPRDYLFGGLNIDTSPADEIYPWPDPPNLPTRVIIADSYGDHSYCDYADGVFAAQAARMLADCNTRIFGVAGLGWTSGGGTAISTLQTNVDVMNANVDRIVYCLGTNDVGQSAATITANVTARLNLDLALSPDAIITVVAGFGQITSTEVNAIIAGVAACSAPTRVSVVSGIGLMAGAATTFKRASDIHPHQLGHDILAKDLVDLLAASEASLLGA